jgi:hypothetical protein
MQPEARAKYWTLGKVWVMAVHVERFKGWMASRRVTPSGNGQRVMRVSRRAVDWSAPVVSWGAIAGTGSWPRCRRMALPGVL